MDIRNFIPHPQQIQDKSRAYELKERLDWGEPALTIVDSRDRQSFQESHISGAIVMPPEELVARALETLELERDIYIYRDTDEETAIAAAELRAVGYTHVSEIRGGLAAWKAFGYPVE